VDAEGHEVVHGVVRGGDGGEDGADWGLLTMVFSRTLNGLAYLSAPSALPQPFRIQNVWFLAHLAETSEVA
jgi:hypothetical protein